MIQADKHVVILDTFPFEQVNPVEFKNQLIKIIIEPNIQHFARLGLSREPRLYSNTSDNLRRALKNEGLFFVHYSRFRDYNPSEIMKDKRVIFYSIGDPTHKPLIELRASHFWLSSKFIDAGKICLNPPFYSDFFDSWDSIEENPPINILLMGTTSKKHSSKKF